MSCSGWQRKPHTHPYPNPKGKTSHLLQPLHWVLESFVGRSRGHCGLIMSGSMWLEVLVGAGAVWWPQQISSAAFREPILGPEKAEEGIWLYSSAFAGNVGWNWAWEREEDWCCFRPCFLLPKFTLMGNKIIFPKSRVESLLLMTVIGKQYSCLYLSPWAFSSCFVCLIVCF